MPNDQEYRNKLGFHVRSAEELVRVTNVPTVDLVELKPDHLKRKSNIELYSFDGQKFSINHENASNIMLLLKKKGIEAQIHIPFEDFQDPTAETGLCQADRSHHPLLLSRMEMFGELHEKYDLGTVLTMHPPAFKLVDIVEWSEKEALDAGIELYKQIDELIIRKGYGFKFDIENMVAPKRIGVSNLGYRPKQIDLLIGDTSHVGITVDTGHRRLNHAMSIAALFSYGEVNNLHFHSNEGYISSTDYKDDQHIFATPENLPHFDRFIKRFRRSALPIILEVKTDKYTDRELATYVNTLRSLI
ncbi:hypothetical protein HN695_05585 [Candidatus Woesearchaeota archaeon]|jgi:sugar phosphate isomerase/epimerase|nr:hypothetical protein [Candidatus Woesearchaeota archaeon]MBT5272209.1 hypothetical protein [Candidatus Woesearchaeota archaeon]MBT6041553.1 hypothetical protein [Candidatus Woesearchaeota archaeon]MBT6336915.1 hypothetical protein [Candidatus Woesearchaeota archaeon]MBT7927785.1 hypothetical protein [Candidatus Woesearchaeota archaeon]